MKQCKANKKVQGGYYILNKEGVLIFITKTLSSLSFNEWLQTIKNKIYVIQSN